MVLLVLFTFSKSFSSALSSITSCPEGPEGMRAGFVGVFPSVSSCRKEDVLI
jgi:hypothetical protein